MSRHPRISLALVLAAIAPALVLGGPTGPAAGQQAPVQAVPEDLGQQLDATTQQLDSARDGLATITGQVEAARRELEQADRQLVGLEARLGSLETRLVDARAVFDQARERSLDAGRDLISINSRLEASLNDLDRRERSFDDRVAAAYKYGSAGLAGPLLGSESMNEFVSTVYYLRSVMDSERVMVEGVGEVAEAIAEDRSAANRIRDQLLREEKTAAAAKRNLEEATEAHRVVTEQVAAEREHRGTLVDELESNQASYEALVGQLETESASVADQIRAFQAAARARAEAEARRVAATAGSGGNAASPLPIAGAPGPGGLVWPSPGRQSSNFGPRVHPIFRTSRLHAGVDIAGPSGTPIAAAAAGTVITAGWYGGYGLAVVIDHGGGLATLYAHQSALTVSAGQSVAAGEQIGAIGSTGYSTGPHLHFEVRVDGTPRDPMAWF